MMVASQASRRMSAAEIGVPVSRVPSPREALSASKSMVTAMWAGNPKLVGVSGAPRVRRQISTSASA